MRTTIELPDELRARLLALAARRGENGFSHLVQEAVARYLDELERRDELARKAKSTIGSLSDRDAEALEDSLRFLRRSWR
jgi:predicted DNA-binding protein